MEIEGQSTDWSGRWNHLNKILSRRGPLHDANYEPSNETLSFVLDNIKILVIGAGGLGCELLKNLSLMGFRNIHVIDMDTIDLSNLNRQFLFRNEDIGRPKAEVAAKFINSRVKGANVVPHFCKIQDKDADFYQQFNLVISGLDSIVARRWINGMLISLLNYVDAEPDAESNGAPGQVLDQSSIIPLIDGGTEGFKGNARVIFPGVSACIECTLDLFPPQVNFPLCTIAQTPRLPEHCIEYVRLLLWPKEQPFGPDVQVDGDDPSHIQWIMEKSIERGASFGIEGVNYRLTQGVVKRIIPAVASTNAIIASVCALETFKVVTSCFQYLDNYMTFSNSHGVYTYSYQAERKDNCVACSSVPQTLTFKSEDKLKDIVNYLVESNEYQMKAPGLTTSRKDGRNQTLYIQSVASLEAKTKDNLRKTLEELELKDGQELNITDVTSPNTLIFVLKLQ